MKKLFIVLFMIFLFEESFSQTQALEGKSFYSKDYFAKRSRHQNTAGWILLVGGTAMAVGGVIGFSDNFTIFGGSDAQARRSDMYGFILLGGVISDLISIPFFISAGHNRRIAASFNLNNALYSIPQQNSVSQLSVPSIQLKIKF